MESIASALDRLTSPAAGKAACFPVRGRFHPQRQKDAAKKLDTLRARSFIKPENTAALIAHLPRAEGELGHGIISGDFVFGDILPAIITEFGCPRRIDLTTLSMWERNVHMLLGVLNHSALPLVSLLISLLFPAVNSRS